MVVTNGCGLARWWAKPVTDVEKLVVPRVSAKVKSALKPAPQIEEFGKRGGFRRKRGAGHRQRLNPPRR